MRRWPFASGDFIPKQCVLRRARVHDVIDVIRVDTKSLGIAAPALFARSVRSADLANVVKRKVGPDGRLVGSGGDLSVLLSKGSA